MDKKSNHIKNVLHGFFLNIATTIAEPQTIMPLIVSYFGGGSILVGLYSSLLRGGAVIIQMYAAFHAQSYKKMLPYFRKVLLARFLSWFLIGLFILLFGENYPTLTLVAIGIGLFVFSFSAGFGAIYFREIVAKIFSYKFRGKTMSIRQFYAGLGAIISGAVAGYILSILEPPYSFGILFLISSFLMAIGFIAIGSVDEPIKEKVSKKEKSFKEFLKNTLEILKVDKELQTQLITFFLSYSYVFALPFIILDAKESINLGGKEIGFIITSQMTGAMLSNLVWGKLSYKGYNKLIAHITIILSIISIFLAFFSNNLYMYMLIFFLIGASGDGKRIASTNLLLLIAPEDKRPIYSAIQTNILSFGMFFSIIGGIILSLSNYFVLYSFSIILLLISLRYSFKISSY